MGLFKRVLAFGVALQLSVSSVAVSQERMVFDFDGDVPDYVYDGPDRFEGDRDGNCTGSGCGDAEGGPRDYDDDHGYDLGPENGEDSFRFDRDGVPERDGKGDVYVRGSDGSRDRLAGENWADHSDIYYDRDGNEYVKSRDGKKLLLVSGLLECSARLDCFEKGYKRDWWSYSTFPGENSAQSQSFFEAAEFYREHEAVGNGIARAQQLASVQSSSGKKAVLREVVSLHSEARGYFINGKREQASYLLNASLQLLQLFVDVGITFTPMAWARDMYEFISGEALVGNRVLSEDERLLSGLSCLVPAVGPLIFGTIKIVGAGQRFGRLGERLQVAVRKSLGLASSGGSGKYAAKTLPPLVGSLREAFDGAIQLKTYRKGEILFQAQRTGAKTPGRWFTPIRPIDSRHAEELLNLNKWGNDAGQIKAFIFKKDVTGYSGKVAGGRGSQFFVPEEVPLSEIVEEIIL